MLTASRLRFLTYAQGLTRRFVDFSVDSFESCRDLGSTGETGVLKSLWARHFADTGFESRMDEFHEMAAEVLLSRSVDAFQYYLADAIAWALWRSPAVQGLKEQAMKLAGESGIDANEAAYEVAWSYAETLSFRGFNAMVKFIETTFGVAVILDATTNARLRRIIATRNMIAHNHSRKNARYCRDVGEPSANIGQSVRPGLNEARAALQDLTAFVEMVDDSLTKKLIDSRVPPESNA